MSIDWANFTPLASSIGGLLIGLAVSILIIFNGKVTGISGIVGGLLKPTRDDLFWRVAFLCGLVSAPIVYRLAAPIPKINIDSSIWIVAIAGILVGFGSRYGSGCTSGHGVCGISRLSKRSFIATLCFIFSGLVTVFFVRHVFV